MPFNSIPSSGEPLTKWLVLENKESANKKKRAKLRIKLKYSEQLVLPLKFYENLTTFLESENFRAVNLLGEALKTEANLISNAVFNIFYSKEKHHDLITTLCAYELLKTDAAGTIFRGTTLSTRVIEYYQREFFSDSYLKETLGNFITFLSESTHSLEIDPTRLHKKENLEENLENLTFVVSKLWEIIQSSINSVPISLKIIYRKISKMSRKKFADVENAHHSAIAGFFFLRFICPAILSPKLFGLIQSHPTSGTERKLTLVAKILQTLANRVSFGPKEAYLICMNDKFIIKNQRSMAGFLDKLTIYDKTAPVKEPLPRKEIFVAKDLDILSNVFWDSLKTVESFSKSPKEVRNF